MSLPKLGEPEKKLKSTSGNKSSEVKIFRREKKLKECNLKKYYNTLKKVLNKIAKPPLSNSSSKLAEIRNVGYQRKSSIGPVRPKVGDN